MKFIHRLGYYLGGFSIGLIVLAFFLSGKKTTCDYSPNARVIKNIAFKPKAISPRASLSMRDLNIDSIQLQSLLKVGNVNFKKSDTHRDSCNLYFINTYFMEDPIEIKVYNCEQKAKIEAIEKLPN